jgi:PAS domain S-box-containing protein
MNSKIATEVDAEEDEWLIYDDVAGDGATEEKPVEEKQQWLILIVDDDLDVHAVTRLALHKIRYKNRGLKFLSAYSRKEAFVVLRDTPDIALVLLDVVMETDDAGLGLAKQIRTELNNQLVRVVLRTGQPGQAPEQSVVLEYDINDYKSKTELTAQKLFTTVVSSLRAFDSLQQAERGKAELAASLAKVKILKLALDQHSMVAITDQCGKITYANDKFCAGSKYSREELLGQGYRIFDSGHHPKQFFSELWATITAGKTWQAEIKNRARDGSAYWVDTTVLPFFNPETQSNQFVAIHTDITQRKQAQASLQASEAQMRHLLGVSPIAVSIERVSDKRRVFANQRFADMFNTSLSIVIGADPLQFYQNPQDHEDIAERLAKGETINNLHVDLLTRDRKKLLILGSYSLIEYEGEEAILAWFYDVAERAQMPSVIAVAAANP